MLDNILTGHAVALRYVKFLALKLKSKDKEVVQLTKFLIDVVDDPVKLRQRYKDIFSNYRIDSEDKKEIVYITEKILEFINK